VHLPSDQAGPLATRRALVVLQPNLKDLLHLDRTRRKKDNSLDRWPALAVRPTDFNAPQGYNTVSHESTSTTGYQQKEKDENDGD
jgi:hypothetical protein